MAASVIFLIIGVLWAFLSVAIGSNHPAPSMTNLDTHFFGGCIVAAFGLVGVLINLFF